jgi:uncharacterized membrane protein
LFQDFVGSNESEKYYKANVVYVPYHLHNYTAIYDEEQVTFSSMYLPMKVHTVWALKRRAICMYCTYIHTYICNAFNYVHIPQLFKAKYPQNYA